MGYQLDPNEVASFSSRVKGTLTNDNGTYGKIEKAIELFGGNQELQGEGWSTLKMQLMNHQTVLRGLICINEMMAAANEEFSAASGNEKLDEDKIQQGIIDLEIARNQCYVERDRYEELINMRQSSYLLIDIAPLTMIYYKIRINDLDQEINLLSIMLGTLYEKKQKLTDIINGTKNLYDEVESLCASVSEGVQALKNSWTGNGYSGIMDCSWAEPINNAWNGLIAQKVTESLKSGDSVRYLEYEEFERLSEEEQQEYLNGMLALLFAMEPGLSLSVGDKIEVPIGPDMKIYYGIEGSGNWKEESAWEINGVIKEQQVVLNEFVTRFDGGSSEAVFDLSSGEMGIKKEFKVSEHQTVTFETTLDIKFNSLKAEYQIATNIRQGAITSIYGVTKKIDDPRGWERVPEPAKQPQWSWDWTVPDTGDDQDLGLLGDLFDWIIN